MKWAPLAALLGGVLAACDGTPPAPPPPAVAASLQNIVVTAEAMPDEVLFDAALEAVHQSTVAAQTSARVEALPFDVGDYVEKGEVIVRFRATEPQAIESFIADVRDLEPDAVVIDDEGVVDDGDDVRTLAFWRD